MRAPVYATCQASAAVKLVLGDPVRVFGFGEADDSVLPYAVHQVAVGVTENTLADVPDMDNPTTQIDVYGETPAQVLAAADAIRGAVELVAYVSGWRGESKDPETKRFRVSFDVDWFTSRS